MKVYQVYNRRINAWVKYTIDKNGKTTILNTKQYKTSVPFKNTRKRQRRC